MMTFIDKNKMLGFSANIFVTVLLSATSFDDRN